MIIRSKAPLRLGLAGGGSDVSPYSDLYGGQILNATINLSAYCTIETQPGETVRVDAYDCDAHVECPLDATLAPAPDLIRGVYQRIVKDFGPVPGAFRITTYNDAPAGSGLGTSSTMVVCILKCFAEWMNLPMGDYETARLAYEIERKDLALAGGKQDQYAAAFGGFNFMEFHQDDIVIVNPLKIKSWIVDDGSWTSWNRPWSCTIPAAPAPAPPSSASSRRTLPPATLSPSRRCTASGRAPRT